MILLLLFFISSTLRPGDAQKPNQKICVHAQIFFYVALSIRNAGVNLHFFIADFLVWSKYGK